jgi:peptidyl-prolyl cis-trans isomerase SurA
LPKAKHVLVSLGVVALTFAVMTSFVYRHDPTNSSVRKIVGMIPYPAAVVGNHVITIGDYLNERDALNAYFQSSAAQSGEAVPDEAVIAMNIMDTMINKVVVRDMADAAGLSVDEAKVEEFYANALGGSDSAAFETQLMTMFGWTPDQFRTRVVRPVVLAEQVGEAISADAARQADRKAQAEAAYERVAGGEDFAAVATEVSSDASATAGGDVGSVLLSDIPEEWRGSIESLAVGDYSKVVDGKAVFMIFKVTAKTGTDADAAVNLSLISIAKETLEEATQSYLATTRDWRFIGNT